MKPLHYLQALLSLMLMFFSGFNAYRTAIEGKFQFTILLIALFALAIWMMRNTIKEAKED